jgi:photosystem II reaction center protein Psb28
LPNIRLSLAATFVFKNPSVFEADNMLGEITGLYMIDEEGEIASVDVNAKFVNGKPDAIEAKHVMRSAFEWDRFMRFMERYAEDNGLGFQGVRCTRNNLLLTPRPLLPALAMSISHWPPAMCTIPCIPLHGQWHDVCLAFWFVLNITIALQKS